MAEQHKAIFAALGMQPADIEAIEKIETKTVDGKPVLPDTFKADDYVGKVNTTLRTKLLNDNEFLNSIPAEKIPESARKAFESGQYTRFLKEMEEVAIELGIPIDTMSADDRKSIKKLHKGTITGYFTKQGGAQSITELQNKLSTALADKTAAETAAEGKVTAAVKAERANVNKLMEKLLITTTLTGIEGLAAKPEYIIDASLSKLKAKYNVVVDEPTMQVMLKQKDNVNLDVLKTDGTILTAREALETILTADGMIKKKETDDDIDPATGKKRVTVVKVNGNDATVIPSYINGNITKAMEAEASNKNK